VYTQDLGRRIQTTGSKSSSSTSDGTEEPNYYQGDNLYIAIRSLGGQSGKKTRIQQQTA
jgi:hypothetical protein